MLLIRIVAKICAVVVEPVDLRPAHGAPIRDLPAANHANFVSALELYEVASSSIANWAYFACLGIRVFF